MKCEKVCQKIENIYGGEDVLDCDSLGLGMRKFDTCIIAHYVDIEVFIGA